MTSETVISQFRSAPPSTPTPIGITAEHVAKMSPATRDQAKALLLDAHADPEAVAALFAKPIADKTAPTPVNTYSGVTAAETARGLQYMLDHGNPQLRDQVLAEAARQKIALNGADGKPLPKADGTVLARTYEFNTAGLDLEDTPIEDVQAFVAEMSGACAALDIPAALAQQTLEAFIKAANVYDEADTPEEVERKKAEQGNILASLNNGTTLVAQAAIGEKELSTVAPEFYKALRENGALLTVQSQLALAAISSHLERSKK